VLDRTPAPQPQQKAHEIWLLAISRAKDGTLPYDSQLNSSDFLHSILHIHID